MNKRKDEILKFVAANLKEHPRDIITVTAEHFNVTNSAISQHLRSLIKDGQIEATGKGRSRSFTFKKTTHVFEEVITPDLHEDQIWNTRIKPILPELKENITNICHYGFTEMFNNVIDHSASKTAKIIVQIDQGEIELVILDSGIGIFKKIKDEFNLPDERQAILELSKGKLTTDPSRHTGEGIFFTSRVFNSFSIWSGELFFSHTTDNMDWLITAKDEYPGTRVSMAISRNSERTLQSVFDSFASADEDFSFSKTIVALVLSKYEGEQLVSRSQAKRILNRVDKFKTVMLDFAKIDFVGRAFIDEIFRVYRNEHPNIFIAHVNANKAIVGLIESVIGSSGQMVPNS